MSTNACWMFKWRAKASSNRWHGDFARVLSKDTEFRGWGFDSPIGRRLWEKLKTGDIIFCYQTDLQSIIGVAKVTRTGIRNRTRYVDLKPIKCFTNPVKIHALKRQHRRLQTIDCLKSGPVQTIYRVSTKETRELSEICGVGDLSKRQNRKTLAAARVVPAEIIGGTKAAVNPTKYAGSVEEWVDILVGRQSLDRALQDASLEMRHSKSSEGKLLFQKVHREIAKMKAESTTREIEVDHTQPKTNDDGIRPGSFCNCGGNNKDCFLCSGTGTVQETTHSANLIHVEKPGYFCMSPHRPRTSRAGFTMCPVCGCDLKAVNLPKHMGRLHASEISLAISTKGQAAGLPEMEGCHQVVLTDAVFA